MKVLSKWRLRFAFKSVITEDQGRILWRFYRVRDVGHMMKNGRVRLGKQRKVKP